MNENNKTDNTEQIRADLIRKLQQTPDVDDLHTFDAKHPLFGLWLFIGVCVGAAVIGWACENIFHLW